MSTTGDESRRPFQSLSTHPVYRTRGEHRHRHRTPIPRSRGCCGDAVEVVARLREASEVPVRSHGRLSVNRALMAAGPVDRVQVTIFPVISGQTGLEPILHGAADTLHV